MRSGKYVCQGVLSVVCQILLTVATVSGTSVARPSWGKSDFADNCKGSGTLNGAESRILLTVASFQDLKWSVHGTVLERTIRFR